MSFLDGERIKITKLEAARRELKTALDLWFADGDLVSTHALAFASYEIIHFVSKRRNRNRDLIFDSDLIKDEYRKDWRVLVSREANFFKHADRDPDGVIELGAGQPFFFIMFALMGLASIGEKFTLIEDAFLSWLGFNHPQLLTEQGRKLYTDPFGVEQLEMIRGLTKSEFLEAFSRARNSPLPRPRGIVLPTHIRVPEF